MNSVSVEEFLLASELNSLEAISNTANDFLEVHAHALQLTAEKEKTVAEKSAIMARISMVIKEPNVPSNFKILVEKQYHLFLLELAQDLNTLRAVDNTANLITLCLTMSAKIEQKGVTIPATSKIRQLLINTCAKLRSLCLRKFHSLFEKQLELSCKTDNNFGDSWNDFAMESRDWLLCHCLVSMLPVVLCNPMRSSCLTSYQDALDEAFTPIWGRYHFQLSSARGNESIRQLLWTCAYTKSFVDVMMKLTDSLTESKVIEKFCQADCRAIACQYVVDRVARFMRSHLVVGMTLCSSASDNQTNNSSSSTHHSDWLRLVDEVLELDHFLCGLHDSSLYLSEALYDVSVMRVAWLTSDVGFFIARTRVVAEAGYEEVYAMQSRLSSPDQQHQQQQQQPRDCDNDLLTKLSQSRHSSSQCYSGVRESVSLIWLATQRYAHLCAPARDSVAEAVLEPLLLLPVALLLFHVRSDCTLCALANSRDAAQPELCFPRLAQLAASVKLVQNFLSGIAGAPVVCAAQMDRFHKSLAQVHSWINTCELKDDPLHHYHNHSSRLERHYQVRSDALQTLVHLVMTRTDSTDSACTTREQRALAEHKRLTHVAASCCQGALRGGSAPAAASGKSVVESIISFTQTMCDTLENNYLSTIN